MATTAIGLGAGLVGNIIGGILDRPTAAQKALNAQMQDFNNYVNAEAKTEGLDATSVFQNLMGPLQRIVQGGPQQAGWSQAETNAYNSQAIQRGAAEARDLGSVAASRAATDTTAGGQQASARLAAQQKAEADTSSAISTGTIQSSEAGRQNFFKAAGEERELPSVFGTSNESNKTALASNEDAQKSQQALDTANKSSSPLGMLSKGMSGLGGAATQGMSAIKNLANNKSNANADDMESIPDTPSGSGGMSDDMTGGF